MKKNVLIVATDADVISFLKTELGKEGYKAEFAENIKAAEKSYAAAAPQLILVDMGVPDAEMTIRTLHANNNVPILVLTGGQDAGQRSAFAAGASDYVMKPLLDPAALMTRLRTAMRLSETKERQEMTFTFRNLQVDIWRRRVSLHGREISLTPIEFDLLALLVRRAGQVVTQAQILKEVWGETTNKNGHYLRIYVQRLRDKLGDDPYSPQYLFTEPRIGYRLNGQDAH